MLYASYWIPFIKTVEIFQEFVLKVKRCHDEKAAIDKLDDDMTNLTMMLTSSAFVSDNHKIRINKINLGIVFVNIYKSI